MRIHSDKHTLTHICTCMTLQHFATHSNTMQHTAKLGTHVTLQHSATLCNTLQHAATCSLQANTLGTHITLQHPTTHCSALQHKTTILQHIHCRPTHSAPTSRCNTLQLIAAHCNTLQHTATHCNAFNAGQCTRHPQEFCAET